jgi:hypothetical protein
MNISTFIDYSNNLTTINLLDFRKDLGNLLDNNQIPLQINKRGRAVGFVLPVNMGQDFLEWKKRSEIKKLYWSQKNNLKTLGRDRLLKSDLIDDSTNLDELSADQIVELVSKI